MSFSGAHRGYRLSSQGTAQRSAMNRDFPQLISLDLVLEAAKDFGLTEQEISRTALEAQVRCWIEPGSEAALLDEVAGALARAILDKQRRLLAAAAQRAS
jgi:hypothetical protein